MPTTRPRHLVTETDAVAAALDAAALRWPTESRTKLLVRLVLEGHRVVADREDEATERRVRAVEQMAGVLTGAYPPDYLDELRADWPP